MEAKVRDLTVQMEAERKQHELVIEELEGKQAQLIASERFWKDKLEKVCNTSLHY